MHPTDDSTLLRQYVETHSDEAFATLVARHINLVYSVAVRCVGDPHQAEEIAQSVFILLANKAATLRHDKALSSWLFQTTRLTASNFIRSETRRHRRELEAHMHSQLDQPHRDLWQRIAPLLDDAVAELSDPDRRAILLRFYEGRSLREVGIALDASEDAAQKRLTRAVERLREFFAQRGVSVGTRGLAVVISANAVQAAPVGLAAALSATAVQTSATIASIKAITMTALQKTLASAVLVVALGTAIYQARQASQWRAQVQMLQPQQAAVADQMEQLRSERNDAVNRVARQNFGIDPSKRDTAELLRLRGEIGVLRAQLSALESDHRKLATDSIPGQFRPRTDWSDKGNQNPFATVETMLWAASQGQTSRVTDVATPEAIAETRWPIFPTEQPPIQTVGAVNLISSSQNQEGTRAVVTAFVREDFMAPPGGSPYSVNKLRGWRLTKSDEGWRISKLLFFDLGGD